jgi:hypothetical protein
MAKPQYLYLAHGLLEMPPNHVHGHTGAVFQMPADLSMNLKQGDKLFTLFSCHGRARDFNRNCCCSSTYCTYVRVGVQFGAAARSCQADADRSGSSSLSRQPEIWSVVAVADAGGLHCAELNTRHSCCPRLLFFACLRRASSIIYASIDHVGDHLRPSETTILCQAGCPSLLWMWIVWKNLFYDLINRFSNNRLPKRFLRQLSFMLKIYSKKRIKLNYLLI